MDFICKYCGKSCKNRNSLAQHEVRCKYNENRKPSYFATHTFKAWNKGLTKDTDERLKKAGVSISKALSGREGHKHTEAEKEHLRECALKNGLGGFNMRKKGIYYNGIKLDSSYEVMLAEILDENNVKWVRCGRIKYEYDGITHFYTPDFYLPDYNLYLDPKNDFLANNINPRLGYSDPDKIKAVCEQNNVRVVILTLDKLNWLYIKTLL